MPPRARLTWTRTLGQLAAILGAAVVVGLLVGHPWPVVTLAALGIVAWHYARLHDVLARLSAGKRIQPPAGDGVWNELDRLLHRSQSDVRARKRRLIDMLRAYRAAAMALPDAVVVLDRNSQRVQWFNPAGSSLLGLRYPRDVGAPLGERLQSMQLARRLRRMFASTGEGVSSSGSALRPAASQRASDIDCRRSPSGAPTSRG